MDEAIAWNMRRYELDPDNFYINCNVAGDLAYLGFVEEAQSWMNRANDSGLDLGCFDKTDMDCIASRETYYSERCKAHRLEKAKQIISSQISMDEKIRYADFVVDNSGDVAVTRKQTDAVWGELLEWKKGM